MQTVLFLSFLWMPWATAMFSITFRSTTITFLLRPFAAVRRGGGRGGLLGTASSLSDAENNNKSRFITYLTDVEGDRDYLDRYVKQSKVLCWKQTNETVSFPYDHCIDFVTNSTSPDDSNDNMLVYGGDVWDQGGSDLYVIRQLNHLSARYPKHTHFVMGNRDINKMRVHQELVSDSNEPPGVYWLTGTQRMGDPLLLAAGSLPLFATNQTAAERLQWMLSHTMGSPRAFEFRRQELQQEANNTDNAITDDDVVASYRSSCHPVTGEMATYLSHAKLVVRLGEVAFMHGALPLTASNLLTASWDDLTFCMPWLEPGLSASDVKCHTLDDWFGHLNAFARENIKAWRNATTITDGMWSLTGGYHLQPKKAQPYGQLLQYGMGSMPGRIPNPTVVYSSWGVNGKPRKFYRHGDDPFDQAYRRLTEEFFERSGLRLICTGHQPAGEMPNHIRVNSDRWIMPCDTSYSGDTVRIDQNLKNLGRGSTKSGRGSVAVSEVVIEQCRASGRILDAYCHGTLSDGSPYRSASLATLSNSVGRLSSPSLAQVSPHGGPWWTQASLQDGSLLLAAGEGFTFWTKRLLQA